jgi:putative Mn2+ efflux pump MntP
MQFLLQTKKRQEYMTFTELLLTAIALAMDAFAVSACKGLNMRKLNWANAVKIGLFFGGFQAAMPLIGWLLGKQFERLIASVDHWIVFGLLAFIGGKMIYDALKGGEEDACAAEDTLDYKQLVVLSFATSVDALAVGISFAFLQVAVLPSVGLIGVTTFALSVLGVAAGQRFGAEHQNKATLFGGGVLIAIGLKILLEHLNVIG